MRQQPGPRVRYLRNQLSRLPGIRLSQRRPGMPDPDDALTMAVRLYRSPGIARSIRRSPLPRGVILVIRVAAGCPISCAHAVAVTGIDEETIARIASLYLLVALFGQEADAQRTLGLAPGAPASEAQDHRNWLLKWLHPDRNRNQTLAGLSVRVLDAFARLVVLQPTVQAEAPPPAEPRRHRVHRRRWVPLPLDG